MTSPSTIRRISVSLPNDIARRLDPYIDWGTKSLVYTKLSEMLADSFERHGKIVTGFLLAGKMEFKLKGPVTDESPRRTDEDGERDVDGGATGTPEGDQSRPESLEESAEDNQEGYEGEGQE